MYLCGCGDGTGRVGRGGAGAASASSAASAAASASAGGMWAARVGGRGLAVSWALHFGEVVWLGWVGGGWVGECRARR